MNSADARDALLQRNFFPAYNEWEEEIPPVFTSQGFSPQVAHDLEALPNLGRFKGNIQDMIRFSIA